MDYLELTIKEYFKEYPNYEDIIKCKIIQLIQKLDSNHIVHNDIHMEKYNDKDKDHKGTQGYRVIFN